MEDNFYTRKDLDQSTVELTITIPKDAFDKSYKSLLEENAKKTQLNGFRKGKVPTDVVESQVSSAIKIETLEKLIPMYLATALQKESLLPIAPPEYKNFPKLDGTEDIKITVLITIMPNFKVGDLKKIKIQKQKATVTDKEVDDVLENIFKNNKTEFKEMNDLWAKEVAKLLKADNVTDMQTLRKYVEGILKNQKEQALRHQLEEEVLEQAVTLSDIKIPEPAIRYEAEERERSFEHDMQSRQIKIEDFLKANDLTIEKMRELWFEDAKQALETDVFLKEYIKERGIKFTDEDLAKKIEEIKSNAPKDTDPSIFEDEEWKEYIRRVSVKDLAFKKFLEEVLQES
ncbi:MAG TPA: trigger factor [Candidatus Dojkabacteria bacterium]|nr:trigger factor [Candidatus Dojkabacteria bacterium]